MHSPSADAVEHFHAVVDEYAVRDLLRRLQVLDGQRSVRRKGVSCRGRRSTTLPDLLALLLAGNIFRQSAPAAGPTANVKLPEKP
jgi:hypothetical protein